MSARHRRSEQGQIADRTFLPVLAFASTCERHKIDTERWYGQHGSQPTVDGGNKRGRSEDQIAEKNLDAADIYIRQLTPGDAALYRGIRLAGLKESPEVFGSTFGAEFTKPLAWFFNRLSNSDVLEHFLMPKSWE